MVEPPAADVRSSSNKEVNKKIKSEMLRLFAALSEPTDSFTNCNYNVDDKYILGVSNKGEIHVLDGTTKKLLELPP